MWWRTGDIDRLKGEPGGVLLAHGGDTFIDALIRENPPDEYLLFIHPVAIGNRAGLFSALRGPIWLVHVAASTSPSGTMIQFSYRPDEVNR